MLEKTSLILGRIQGRRTQKEGMRQGKKWGGQIPARGEWEAES